MIASIQIGKAYKHKTIEDRAIVVSGYEKGYIYYYRLDELEMNEHCLFYVKLLRDYEECGEQ